MSSGDSPFLAEAPLAEPFTASYDDLSVASTVPIKELIEELSALKSQLSSTEESCQFLEDDNAQLKSLLSSALQ
jgi:hypothetical protein